MDVLTFQLKTLTGFACVLALSSGQALAKDDVWFFTANEIANAYRYQLQFGARLRSPLEPKTCAYGQQEFLASYQGRRFMAPCRFIAETVRQLKELLESGSAKYIFPLDLDYADLAVPADVYRNKYEHLAKNEILPALLHEPALTAIYRTAVHLDQQVGSAESDAHQWGANRTIAGFYDGRPNQISDPRSDEGEPYYKTDGLVRLGSFDMMAHFLGEIVLVAKETVVTFDLSFDNDRETESNPDILSVKVVIRK